MIRFINKHWHRLIVPIYMAFYLIMFVLLENRDTYRINMIQTKLDYKIPFCEYFIIPYILWFFFVFFTVLWFMFQNRSKKEYIQLILNLMIGMTVFLIISWIYPNGHFLRPVSFPRDNFFTDLVRLLYKADTSTNILPSIHVYNSIAACIAVVRCRRLQSCSVCKTAVCVLAGLIVLATLFLKQHTIIDVVVALALNLVTYVIIYSLDDYKMQMKERMLIRINHL